GALFAVNVLISTQSGLPGLFLPVIFKFNQFGEATDNTLNDSAGALVITEDIVFVSGGVNVAAQSAIILGDINLNGVPFEVADALRFTNYFIDQTKYGFTPQQFANSDVNRDGIAASIADLVTLLSIVTSGSGSGRIVGGVSPQLVTVTGGEGALTLSGARGIAAGLFEFRSGADMVDFEQSLRLSDDAVAAGMELHSHSRDGVTRVLLISGTGGAFEADEVTALVWPSTLSAELTGVELASAAGRTVEGVLAGDAAALPDGFALEQNYPNPFNPSTTIRFALAAPAAVRLDVFDALGRKVTTLAHGTYGAGSHTVTWDGENSSGETVASGVYFYRLQAGGQSLARKMALLK
ncbi:MAG TPA: FlgD immunoglobulin-like domain containing protein, partial [candidate division Zixibacteria bacterium]|nr:FlgD immunoglobulin-like domain containing protein [candidate division Zixibacteria bacterium]